MSTVRQFRQGIANAIWEQGRAARRNGTPLSDCPFKDSWQRELWRSGWTDEDSGISAEAAWHAWSGQ